MNKMRFVLTDQTVNFPLERLLNKPEGVDPTLVRHEYIDPPFRLHVRNLRIEDGVVVGDVGPHYEGLDRHSPLDLSKLYVVVAKPVLGGTDAA
jgi:hypothetical protein